MPKIIDDIFTAQDKMILGLKKVGCISPKWVEKILRLVKIVFGVNFVGGTIAVSIGSFGRIYRIIFIVVFVLCGLVLLLNDISKSNAVTRLWWIRLIFCVGGIICSTIILEYSNPKLSFEVIYLIGAFMTGILWSASSTFFDVELSLNLNGVSTGVLGLLTLTVEYIEKTGIFEQFLETVFKELPIPGTGLEKFDLTVSVLLYPILIILGMSTVVSMIKQQWKKEKDKVLLKDYILSQTGNEH